MNDLLEHNEKNSESIVFEDALAEIDTIVEKLESGEIALDNSLEMFQRGMQLIDFCSKKLNDVEEKLKVLLEGTDGEFSIKESE
jgi:exodeoxyribonuclease VII small subunit